MKYSLRALTIASTLFLAGCNKENGCSSCSDTEPAACSACPSDFPAENTLEVVEEDTLSDDMPSDIIIDEEK